MNDDHSRNLAEQHLGSPRLHMFFILNICGLTGFLTSYFLVRHLGVEAMWLRYGIAALLAYVSFFVLLKFWIVFFIRGESGGSKVISAKRVKKAWKNLKQIRKMKLRKGGTKGARHRTTSSWSLDEAVPDGSDKDGFILIVLVVALMSVLVIAGMFILAAPVFWGEVIGAALLGSGGYNRFKGVPQEEWYETAFRRSRGHFLALLIVLVIAGGTLQYLAPEAVTIGDVVRILLAE